MILYLLSCEGNSFYTGITPDLEARLQAHLGQKKGGARATKMKKPLSLAAAWEFSEPRAARSLEAKIKRLSHAEKAALAKAPETLFFLFPDEKGRGIDPAPFNARFFS